VLETRDTRNTRDHEHLGPTEVEGPPATFPARVVAGAAFLATRAAPTVLDSRSQSDLENLTDEFNILNSHTLGVDAQSPR
jgi:hypothetical protein